MAQGQVGSTPEDIVKNTSVLVGAYFKGFLDGCPPSATDVFVTMGKSRKYKWVECYVQFRCEIKITGPDKRLWAYQDSLDPLYMRAVRTWDHAYDVGFVSGKRATAQFEEYRSNNKMQS